MIAYRAEVWCDGFPARSSCQSGKRDGTPHDDPSALPILARNREELYLKQGWTKDGDRHYCPQCTARRRAAAQPPAGVSA